ncbi:MAG: penicillin-binding protein 2 [Pseudomonadota bacterium]|jgi:penicillin-binding protein 2
MTELKNLEHEIGKFRFRLFVAAGAVLLGFALLVARLVWLQVVRHDDLSTQAENNRIAVLPIVPNRGLILDRNGVVLANNYSAYTLEITPSKTEDLEQTIDQLAELVEITPRDRKRFKRLMDDGKSFASLPIRTKLSDEEVARFTAQQFRFPGVEIKARLFRYYPYGELASHVLGYIGRINQVEKEAIDETDDAANYRGTEYIGKLGIEQRYEEELHGQTGFEEVETSAGGRAVRRLRASPATPGNTIKLSIDIKLQALIEELFGERRGALVALDPRTGEVLAFVSKPTFDPNLFVDGIDAESWKELNESIDKPLLNRALRGTYPPGSTFKPFMAMAALNTGKRTPSQTIMDNGSFWFGNHKFRSHGDGGLGVVDMYRSIVKSSNVYYYQLAADMGVDLMHDELEPFGFGRRTGIDLNGEVTGVLPSTAWKKKTYRRPELQRWYPGETISLGIGQGYNNFTMLQLAYAMATLASGGQRFEPRVVREIEDVITHERRTVASSAIEPLPLKPEHVSVVRKALYGVTQEGTAARVFPGAPYQSGGKTGTAQAVGIKADAKYDKNKIGEYQRDHSLYIAVAPIDDPQVALAVIVENAGFGAEAAAPIARRVLDYLLAGRYPSAEDIALVREGKGGTPIGVSRPVAEVPLPQVGGAGSGAVMGLPGAEVPR